MRVTDRLDIPDAELSWRFSRSSGPGGQSVNTSDSRAELSFDVAGSAALSDVQRARALARLGKRLASGVLTVAASEHRSQLQNREAAIARMASLLADAVAAPAPARRPTRRTKGSQERRLDVKRQRSDLKRRRARPAEE